MFTAVLVAAGYTAYRYHIKSDFLPTVQEHDPVFFTNWDYDVIQIQKVKQQPGLAKTFNISMTVYSQELANKLGLLPDYISTELTPGMYSFEVHIKTTDNRTDCIFNALLDNKLPLDFPEQPLIAALNGAKLPIIKSDLPDLTIKEFRDKRINNYTYYNRNNYFATANYDPAHPSRPTMMFQPSPELIIKEFLPGIAWVSLIEFSCGSKVLRFLELPNPTLWIKKKDGSDYRYRAHLDKNDFIKFTIPQPLIDRILPIIKEAVEP